MSKKLGRIFPNRRVNNIGFSSQLGHAHIAARLSNGTVTGGSDHRGDGVSIPVA
jgi:hypothetical protein